MEISPIAGVRIAPMIRSKAADLGLTDVCEVERSTRTADEIYSPSITRAASGIEDDEDTYDDLEDDCEMSPKVKAVINGQINYMA